MIIIDKHDGSTLLTITWIKSITYIIVTFFAIDNIFTIVAPYTNAIYHAWAVVRQLLGYAHGDNSL